MNHYTRRERVQYWRGNRTVECGICSSDDIHEGAYSLSFDVSLDSQIDTQIHRCRSCGVHFRGIDFNSQVGEHFDVVGYVRKSNKEAQRKVREPYFRFLLTEIARELGSTQGKKMLDIGCSYGHMMQLFETEAGLNVSGVELNAELRTDLIREGYRVSADVATVQESSFDVITLIDSLYYFQDPLSLLKQVRGLLKDDGILMLRVTNRVWLANLYRVIGRRVPYVCMGDAKYSFTYNGLLHLLNRAGFAVQRLIVAEKGKGTTSIKKRLFYKCTQIITTLGIAKISPGLLLICRKT